jgi:hypothetical protein
MELRTGRRCAPMRSILGAARRGPFIASGFPAPQVGACDYTPVVFPGRRDNWGLIHSVTELSLATSAERTR